MPHLAVDLAIDLPAPRSHRQPRFLAYRESLLRALGLDQTKKLTMLHLNAFLMGVGHHEAAWRLPESDPFAQTDISHFTRLARIAECPSLRSVEARA